LTPDEIDGLAKEEGDDYRLWSRKRTKADFARERLAKETADLFANERMLVAIKEIIDASNSKSQITHKDPISSSNGDKFKDFLDKHGDRALDEARKKMDSAIWKTSDFVSFVQYQYDVRLYEIEKSISS
jgi:hypothetical protein